LKAEQPKADTEGKIIFLQAGTAFRWAGLDSLIKKGGMNSQILVWMATLPNFYRTE
jgi:hypothetical protein